MIVHVLYYGSPLCRFMQGVPGEWPEGHQWVSYRDTSVRTAANCEECLIRFEALSKTRKRRGRVRVTIHDSSVDESHAELHLPIEAVMNGLANFTDTPIMVEYNERGKTWTIHDFWANGDGIRWTIERIPKGEASE